jgi:Rad3-related DNA helicase
MKLGSIKVAPIKIPPPRSLGFPPQFRDWRRGQDAAIRACLKASPRAHLIVAPVGSGKSGIAVAYATMLRRSNPKARIAILTSTKGLLDQYQQELGGVGLFDVRGAGNYKCLALEPGGVHEKFYSGRPGNCADGPCHMGLACALKARETGGGCLYYDRVRQAASEKIVITNYSMWFAYYGYSDGFGKFDAVICDEAHQAPEELAKYLRTEILVDEVVDWGIKFPTGEQDQLGLKTWGYENAKAIEDALEALGKDTETHHAKIRQLKRLKTKLHRVAQMSGEWVWWHQKADEQFGLTESWTFSPLWPAPYGELLFRSAPRIILTSATVRPQHAGLLGLEDTDFDVHEVEHTFPIENRRVVILSGKSGYGPGGSEGVPQVRYGWSHADQQQWVNRIDEIIAARLDRKGLIHTVSYALTKLLRERSKFSRYMYTPYAKNTAEKVALFKVARPPAILVGPQFATGWSFPGDECRYNIVGKIPFPSTQDPLTQARSAADKSYPTFLAATGLVQALGRGNRSEDDWCENIVVDRQAVWFVQKVELFPEWFLDQIVTSYGQPEPR